MRGAFAHPFHKAHTGTHTHPRCPYPPANPFARLPTTVAICRWHIYRELSEEPVAAASLGQVFRGVVRGEDGNPDIDVRPALRLCVSPHCTS